MYSGRLDRGRIQFKLSTMALPYHIRYLSFIINIKIVCLIVDDHSLTIIIYIHRIDSALHQLIIIAFGVDPDRTFDLPFTFSEPFTVSFYKRLSNVTLSKYIYTLLESADCSSLS